MHINPHVFYVYFFVVRCSKSSFNNFLFLHPLGLIDWITHIDLSDQWGWDFFTHCKFFSEFMCDCIQVWTKMISADACQISGLKWKNTVVLRIACSWEIYSLSREKLGFFVETGKLIVSMSVSTSVETIIVNIAKILMKKLLLINENILNC